VNAVANPVRNKPGIISPIVSGKNYSRTYEGPIRRDATEIK
jgi:hypothetical protein